MYEIENIHKEYTNIRRDYYLFKKEMNLKIKDTINIRPEAPNICEYRIEDIPMLKHCY